jgi:hypothetical protein
MRGDGEKPPLTEEEDRQRGGAKGHQMELQKLLMEDGLMRCGLDGVSAVGKLLKTCC